MNRREFLLSAASAALLSHPARAAEKPNGVPAIDTHVHFYDPTRPEGVPWPRPSEALLYAPHLPDKFRAASASLNVLGTIVVEASPWVEDNQWFCLNSTGMAEGPMPIAAVKAMPGFSPSVYVWKKGMASWQQLSTLSG